MAVKKEVSKKKTVGKVEKKKEGKPKKVVEEVNEPIVDDINEEMDFVEKLEERKTYRELRTEFRSKKNELEVEILNLNSGATTCVDRNGRVIFSLRKTGDREFLPLVDIDEVASKYKGFFEKHKIAIIDIDSDEYDIQDILTYLNLYEIYDENGIENYDTDYITQILKMNGSKFTKLIEDANEDLVRMIASRAIDLFKDGKFDSRIKEMALAKRLGKEELFDSI